MFSKKKEINLGTTGNSFVQEGLRKTHETLSGNGALKYTSTGNDFVDQFGSIGEYRLQRDFATISKDINLLYSQNKEKAVKFILYLRLISRKCRISGGTTSSIQKGVGMRYESIMRMLWLYSNDQKVFWQNLSLFISCGSWKDIIDMMRIDLEYNGFENKILNWVQLTEILKGGLVNEETTDLVRKYLPTIISNNKCDTERKKANTIIGRFLSYQIFGQNAYKQYRELKSTGKGHIWQQNISKQLFDSVDFDTIPGRALFFIVNSKFISNHNLDTKFEEWIEKQPIAKFKGFVHELGHKVEGYPRIMPKYLKMTLNKQYEGLLDITKENLNKNSNIIVVRDTSSSMKSPIKGQKISSHTVAKSLSIMFSEALQGIFKDTWVDFNFYAELKTFKGDNFVDKYINDNSVSGGSTNLQAVISLFIELKIGGVPEYDFPKGILCVSDGEFDRTYQQDLTNVSSTLLRLKESGFSNEYIDNFKIIFWDIPNTFYDYSYDNSNTTRFETYGETKNVFYLSGYDGSILSFLLGTEETTKEVTTSEELFEVAMNQEILSMVKI